MLPSLIFFRLLSFFLLTFLHAILRLFISELFASTHKEKASHTPINRRSSHHYRADSPFLVSAVISCSLASHFSSNLFSLSPLISTSTPEESLAPHLNTNLRSFAVWVFSFNYCRFFYGFALVFPPRYFLFSLLFCLGARKSFSLARSD